MGIKEIKQEDYEKKMNITIGYILAAMFFLLIFILIRDSESTFLKIIKWTCFGIFAFSVLQIKLINRKR
jgi:hypothetical protein